MRNLICSFLSLFTVTPLLAQNHSNSNVELQSFTLKECVIDQPFDERLIDKTHRFGTNGYKWYVTSYQHTYQVIKKILIVAVSEQGQLYEKEVETQKFMSQSFTFKAEYWEKDEHNNFTSQTSRLKAELARYLISREPMQCKIN